MHDKKKLILGIILFGSAFGGSGRSFAFGFSLCPVHDTDEG